jgi:hypothetical protein
MLGYGRAGIEVIGRGDNFQSVLQKDTPTSDLASVGLDRMHSIGTKVAESSTHRNFFTGVSHRPSSPKTRKRRLVS